MSEKRPSQYPKRYRPRIARTAEHDWLNDAKDRSIKTWDRLSALPACHTENDRLEAYPTTKTPGLALLAMNSAAIAKTYFEHGQFVRFMQLPLNFRLITTGPSCNTLAAPLLDWAINPLNDVHQGRVIFFDSANCGRCANVLGRLGICTLAISFGDSTIPFPRNAQHIIEKSNIDDCPSVSETKRGPSRIK